MGPNKSKNFVRGELASTILRAAGTGLIIGAVLTVPGLLIALKPFVGTKTLSRQSFGKTYKALRRGKLVSVKRVDGEYLLELTERGKRRQKLTQLIELAKNAKNSMPKNWDRKWHLLVFDIPESQKESREALRKFLGHFGFYKFQDSVFIHPFDYQKEIDLFKEMFGLQEHIYCFPIEVENVPPHVTSHFTKTLDV